MKKRGHQYYLFESLMEMMLCSSTVEQSLHNLIGQCQWLLESGWHSTRRPEDLRSLYLQTVMGNLLRSFHCGQCGAQFIVNREPHHSSDRYQCPSCHYSGKVGPDDTFVKVFLTEQQLTGIRSIGELERENAALRPFVIMLTVPCDLCKKPIEEWDLENILLDLNGLGWAHTKCWNTPAGQMARVIRQFNKEGKGPAQIVLPKPVANPSNDQAPPHD